MFGRARASPTEFALGHVGKMCFPASGGISWSSSAFWYNRSVKHRRTILSHSGGSSAGTCRSYRNHAGHIEKIIFLTFDGIIWSCSAFWYDRREKRRRTILVRVRTAWAWAGPTEIMSGHVGKTFLSHLVVSVGDVVRFGTAGARNVDALFFSCLRGFGAGPSMSHINHVGKIEFSHIRWYLLIM